MIQALPGTELIDPRIRQRRTAVRRRQGRRRLRLVVVLLVLTAAVAGGWAATRSPLLDVDRVEVAGAARTGPRAVLTAAAIGRGTAMLDVAGARAGRRVEALPWVLRATVRRSWPGTISIRVVERTPVAVTSDDGRIWAVVDVTGRVLDRAPVPPPGLVVLEGAGPAGARGSRMTGAAAAGLEVAAALPGPLAADVAKVTVADGQVTLALRPEGVVLLGPPTELAAKLRAALTVLAEVDRRGLATLDVRLPATPSLTRRGGVK